LGDVDAVVLFKAASQFVVGIPAAAVVRDAERETVSVVGLSA
jgi:hypothetical protein